MPFPSVDEASRIVRKWFASEFGSTQCRKVTGCDVADTAGVSRYIDGEQVTPCRAIARRVAEQVEMMLAAGSVA